MFQQAMAEKPDIDAIFCTNDDWRLARCWSVRHSSTMCREKWRLPVSTGWKLAVRGCKIASVITPRFEIGKTAADILIKRLNGKDAPGSVNLGYQIYYGDTL